jgi:putative ABC transport system permease protein
VIEINSFRLTGEKGKAGVPVLGLVEESSGGCCYISPDGLRRYFAVPEASNVLSLIVEDGAKDEVRQQLAGMKNVLFVSDNEQMAALMVEALSTLVVLMQGLAFFSVVAGAVMIYHIVNISIIERQNEFGTLMVLGMSSREIDEVVTFEQTINLVVGILLALPMIKFLSGAVVSAVETSGISFNINITPQYYLLAFTVILPVFAITIRSILRLIRRIVLTEVLKGRE